jgi:hypothetical protein
MEENNPNSFENRMERALEETYKNSCRLSRLEAALGSLLAVNRKMSRVLECSGTDIDPNVTAYTPKEIGRMSADEYRKKVVEAGRT